VLDGHLVDPDGANDRLLSKLGMSTRRQAVGNRHAGGGSARTA
jgi:hypothetical protein